MNKAVSGLFRDTASAQRATNDLKASGFPGVGVLQVVRERAQKRPTEGLPSPAGETLKGLIIGAISGLVLALLGTYAFAMTLAIPFMGVPAEWGLYLALGVTGAVAGLLAGIAASMSLAKARRMVLARFDHEVLVAVHTDEQHIPGALTLLETAGGFDVRRGAASVPEDFATVESVQPEPIPWERHEPVSAPPLNEMSQPTEQQVVGDVPRAEQ